MAHPSTAPAGVGLVFDEDNSIGVPRVFVRRLVPGGAAEASRRVRRGDMIVLVNGEDVYGKSLEYLTSIIPGRQGTSVRLGFGNQDGSFVEVNLLRGTVRTPVPNAWRQWPWSTILLLFTRAEV
jgi:C-terminal processing protease CtpA/Prc